MLAHTAAPKPENRMANKQLVPLEPAELGPAASKLTSRQLRFAVALVSEVTPGPKAAEAAAIVAGFKSGRDYANRLAHDPRIIAAVEELARQRLTLDVPQALDTLRSAMSDKFSKDKVRAATALLDRVIPTKQELTVKAEPIDRTKAAIEHLRRLQDMGASHEMLLRKFGPQGLQHFQELARQQDASRNVIDVEFSPVPEPKIDDVEDWAPEIVNSDAEDFLDD
jgi:phage terminase small subunit